MVVSDDIQRFMPTAKDYGKGQQLAYKETVLLTNPSNLEFRGEVDDKYHDEFLTVGPFKQVLTSHVGPTALSEFHSDHYVGMSFAEEEP
ncbi:hypothetical protein TB1_027843 [Malus domestica]